ncbi:tripartite-type tricarboxylate transporter receptor subunit TctC [Pseudochelatococcus lubricantis]|uniref:Tripartite-type tricarboxylate transporter receptor subunit TctC n=1 Tax=Pseudochelatococcus lubricantis TaxID=1538102 RepID=A0ABX0V775_9HYPH|nr:tripartite tricarboxylate transporter substrate binding protein [Pseudochelatococcus lubricantis]NIJ59949.1 tripartite-type tricarboxylate transporter receptor subunit TctC [Pseudochelatococcus lubricantis]
MYRLLSAGLALSLMAGSALAQTAFPTQPITVVVGFAPGGGMDTMARLVSGEISPQLGQPVIVENRPGAAGTLAPAFVASAKPDGYTIYAGETSAILGPVFQGNVGYDPVKSFTPIARIAVAPHALVANPGVGVSTVAQFIDLVSKNPGEYFYASPGTATLQYLAGEMLKDAAGIEMEAVHFQGGAPSVAAVVSGEVPFGIVSLSAAAAQAEGGKLVILGHTGPERVKGFEKIPPIAETIKGFEAMPSQFIMAPAGTPQEIVDRITGAIARAYEGEKLPGQLTRAGLIPAFQTGGEVSAELPAIAKKLTEVAISVRDGT